MFSDTQASSHLAAPVSMASGRTGLRVVRGRSLEKWKGWQVACMNARCCMELLCRRQFVSRTTRKWTRRDSIEEHQWQVGDGGLGIPPDL